MPKGSWGRHMNQNPKEAEIMASGAWLSKELNCAVHYPAYDENMFECACGCTFPLFIVRQVVSDSCDQKTFDAVMKNIHERHQ